MHLHVAKNKEAKTNLKNWKVKIANEFLFQRFPPMNSVHSTTAHRGVCKLIIILLVLDKDKPGQILSTLRAKKAFGRHDVVQC